MMSTRTNIALLQAYYTTLFAEMNAVSKCKGGNFKFCMCDTYDVFNTVLKKQYTRKQIKKDKNNHLK